MPETRIINFQEVARRKAVKDSRSKYLSKLLSKLQFNEFFGTNLHYDELDDESLRGVDAWIRATNVLAYWDELKFPAICQNDLKMLYIDDVSLSYIEDMYSFDFDIKDWFKIMRIVGVKYGFPLWVCQGSSHTIEAYELIRLQAMYAKRYYHEIYRNPYPKSTTVENLYPIYCLKIKLDPHINVNELRGDAVNDDVTKCKVDTIRNCRKYKDILTGDNWLTTDFEKKFLIAAPVDPDDVVCTIEQREQGGFEW